MQKTNKIILSEDWGVFIGDFEDNIYHQHYAVQINVPLFGKLSVIIMFN